MVGAAAAPQLTMALPRAAAGSSMLQATRLRGTATAVVCTLALFAVLPGVCAQAPEITSDAGVMTLQVPGSGSVAIAKVRACAGKKGPGHAWQGGG